MHSVLQLKSFCHFLTVSVAIFLFIYTKESSEKALTPQNRQISTSSRNSRTESCLRQVSYKVVILSVTHAPGFCTTTQCKRHQNEWIIHGLWPGYGNASSPEFCCYQPFLNKTTLAPIMDKLQKNWKNVVQNQTEWNKWIHQWRKHGTCYGSKVKGQLNYFQTALQLFDRVNISRWISTRNITYGGTHHVDNIGTAIDQGFGKRVFLSCSGNAANSSSPALTEIHFCFEPDTLTKIDCPRRRRHNCRTKTGLIALKTS